MVYSRRDFIFLRLNLPELGYASNAGINFLILQTSLHCKFWSVNEILVCEESRNVVFLLPRHNQSSASRLKSAATMSIICQPNMVYLDVAINCRSPKLHFTPVAQLVFSSDYEGNCAANFKLYRQGKCSRLYSEYLLHAPFLQVPAWISQLEMILS
jgi:hypothetical protein